jgi:hypothetical protein
MNKHYDKYKETIKKVARRHRLLNDRKIRALSKKSEDKTEVLEYISKNEIVCRNCFQKRDSDIITN